MQSMVAASSPQEQELKLCFSEVRTDCLAQTVTMHRFQHGQRVRECSINEMTVSVRKRVVIDSDAAGSLANNPRAASRSRSRSRGGSVRNSQQSLSEAWTAQAHFRNPLVASQSTLYERRLRLVSMQQFRELLAEQFQQDLPVFVEFLRWDPEPDAPSDQNVLRARAFLGSSDSLYDLSVRLDGIQAYIFDQNAPPTNISRDQSPMNPRQ